jgi:hypothetical protein
MEGTSYQGREAIGNWHLIGDDNKARDLVVRIDSCVRGEKVGQGRQAKRKEILHITDQHKRQWSLVCGSTMCKTIERMYGENDDNWPGKYITLFRTTTDSPDGQVPCIRIRPERPKGKASAASAEPNPDDDGRDPEGAP